MKHRGRPPGYRNSYALTPVGDAIDSTPQDQKYRTKMAKASDALLGAILQSKKFVGVIGPRPECNEARPLN